MNITQYTHSHKFICWDDSRNPIGFLDYIIPSDDSEDRNVEIKWLEVEKKDRGKGIGSRLMEAFLAFAIRQKYLWVSFWTGKEIEEAGKGYWYAKWFEMGPILPDYYGPGIGTRLYTRRLS